MSGKKLFQYHYFSIMFFLLSFSGYFYLAHSVDRSDTPVLVGIWVVLGIFYLIHMQKAINWKQILVFAILLRCVFLLDTPSLSDDFYRFLWDGTLWLDGINPYLLTPDEYVNQLDEPSEKILWLYGHLNSPDYHTVYPMFAQLYFIIGALGLKLSGLNTALFFMHMVVIVSEWYTIILLVRLLERLKLPKIFAGYYALNPLIIIELTGNLHPEAVMLPFLLAGTLWLIKGHMPYAILAWGTAVSVKFLPLMFLPLMFKKIGKSRAIAFYMGVGMSALIFSIPFLWGGMHQNLLSSLLLYFQKFEFNASIYYLLREIGYWVVGYNAIAFIAPVLAVLTVIYIFCLSLDGKNGWRQLLAKFKWAFLVFLLLSTTVHPWYLAILLAFSLFSRYRFPWVWSLSVSLSYAAYADLPFEENLYLVALSYVIPFIYFLYELKNPNRLLR